MQPISNEDQDLLTTGLPQLRFAELSLPSKPTIYYREIGPADGIPVLMLHGGSSDSGDYRGQMAGMGERYRLISWCTPGVGGSSLLPQREPEGKDYADVLFGLAQFLGLESAHIVGSSLGSVIGLYFAVHYPQATRSLTMIAPNTGAGFLIEEDLKVWRKEWSNPQMLLEALPDTLASMLTAPDAPQIVKWRAGQMRESMTAPGFEQVINMFAKADTVKEAPRVKAPVLILTGNVDHVAPRAEHVEPLARALSDCRVEVLEGGHLLQIHAPSSMNRHLDQFIASIEQQRA